jgi:hypothetical protein
MIETRGEHGEHPNKGFQGHPVDNSYGLLLVGGGFNHLEK